MFLRQLPAVVVELVAHDRIPGLFRGLGGRGAAAVVAAGTLARLRGGLLTACRAFGTALAVTPA